jgi:hypothetical protein
MRDAVKAASENERVPVMYVRNVPEQLLRLVRSQAALQGQSMGRWVIDAVQQRLERDGVEVPDEDEGGR